MVRRPFLALPLVAAGTGLLLLAQAPAAFAAQATVGLGTATSFAVLAGTTVTNVGPSVISGDLGVSPGSAVTGFPPGSVINGTMHVSDAVALQAQNDVTTAYNDAAGRTPVVDKTSQDLGGQTLVSGVYQAANAMALTGTVTLDAQGDPNAVFIFQAGSTLITASSSTVALIGGAQACNVFWKVGSSATLGTSTTFVGSILALTSATLQTGASVQGRVLARNGQVSLDTNTITRPGCNVVPTSTASPSSGPTSGTTATATAGGTDVPGGDTSTGPDNPNGTGGPDGPRGPNAPRVPVGHPHTGTVAPSTGPAGLGWLTAGALALTGAAGAAVLGSRSGRRRTRSRHSAGQ
ncbi:ice-binding family protein [Nocardioides sp.]|uniref:ice-binding family protein n=1 Tax=Nocardioides sp. TaxID=35761 RepID=UPI003D132301